jgi:hypothetical protein
MRPLLLLLSISALAVAPRAHAASTFLEPVKDGTLYQSETGALSNGAGEFVFSGRTGLGGPGVQRAVLAFDLSAIPLGVTIDAARLTLTRSKGLSAGPFALHALSADWGEGAAIAPRGQGSGAPAEPGNATWIHTFSADQFWVSPGGDFEPVPSASASIAGGELVFGGPGLVADIESWLLDPAQNAGWIVISALEAEPGSAVRFFSREGIAAPTLEIQYASAVPEPSVTVLLLLVAATWGARRE